LDGFEQVCVCDFLCDEFILAVPTVAQDVAVQNGALIVEVVGRALATVLAQHHVYVARLRERG